MDRFIKLIIIILLPVFVTMLFITSIEKPCLLNANIFWGNTGEKIYEKSGIKKKVEERIFTESSVKGLSASDGVYEDKIEITWDKISGAVKAEKYFVYRSDSAYGPYIEIGITSSTSYDDAGVIPGVTYYYKIRAYNSSVGYNKYSGYDSGYRKLSAVPAVPAGLIVDDITTNSISLSWGSVKGAIEYRIYCSSSSNGPYTLIGTTGTLSYNDTGLTLSTTYYYKVSAANAGGESAQSSWVSATVGVPNMPTGLFVEAVTTNSVNLSWDSVSNVIAYKIYRSTNSNGPYSLIGTSGTSSYNDTGLTLLTEYYYKTSATNIIGESAWTSWVKGIPVLGVIKVASGLPDGTYTYTTGTTNITITFNSGNCTHIADIQGLGIFTNNGTYFYNNITGYLEMNLSGSGDLGGGWTTTTIMTMIHDTAFTVDNGTKLYFEGMLEEKISGNGGTMPGHYTNYFSIFVDIELSWGPFTTNTIEIMNYHLSSDYTASTVNYSQVITGTSTSSTNYSGTWADNGDGTITINITSPPSPPVIYTPTWVYFNNKWYLLSDTEYYQRQ